jgi:putative nucleotidyltransferase with HDIG domain
MGGGTVKDTITRDEAWALIQEYGCSENHIRHMLAVEASMRAYARRFGADEEEWGAIGLVHDFDYDHCPDEHPLGGGRILRERGYSERVVDAVLAHGETGVPRDTTLSKALFAVDELTGFLVAVTLVRPSKSIADVRLKSIRKKWKDKAFAAAVNRTEIAQGAEAMGVELWEHVATVLTAMQSVAAEIGLDGRLAQT